MYFFAVGAIEKLVLLVAGQLPQQMCCIKCSSCMIMCCPGDVGLHYRACNLLLSLLTAALHVDGALTNTTDKAQTAAYMYNC